MEEKSFQCVFSHVTNFAMKITVCHVGGGPTSATICKQKQFIVLRIERTSGLWSKVRILNLSVDQRILFLSKNNFTAHYLVFACKSRPVNTAVALDDT